MPNAASSSAGGSTTGVEDIGALAKDRTVLEDHLLAAQTPQDEQHGRRRAAALDRQIDRLVYGLYGLSDAEVAIVESSFEKE